MNTILVYHGFFINGRVIPDGIEKKLYEVREKLTRGKIDQYFFEVTINVADQDIATCRSLFKAFSGRYGALPPPSRIKNFTLSFLD